MAMPPETLIAVALVIFVGYTVFGATGWILARGWCWDFTRAGKPIPASS